MHSSTAEESDLHGPHTSSGLSGKRGGCKEAGKEQDSVIITIDNHMDG